MSVETLTFPGHPRLKAILCVADTPSSSVAGTGSVCNRAYELHIVEEGAVEEGAPDYQAVWVFPIEADVEKTVEAALKRGENPTLAIFEENSAMLDQLRAAHPRVHAAIVQLQINQTIQQSPPPPSARPSSL